MVQALMVMDLEDGLCFSTSQPIYIYIFCRLEFSSIFHYPVASSLTVSLTGVVVILLRTIQMKSAKTKNTAGKKDWFKDVQGYEQLCSSKMDHFGLNRGLRLYFDLYTPTITSKYLFSTKVVRKNGFRCFTAMCPP